MDGIWPVYSRLVLAAAAKLAAAADEDVIARPYRARLLQALAKTRQLSEDQRAGSKFVQESGADAVCAMPINQNSAARRGQLSKHYLQNQEASFMLPAGCGGRTSSGIINETL